ncbi:hypothetical protein LTR36_000693 [Oleoguttula mirabilis]|uniref:Uncharacterized protein n=1 Tax=Oleoguttula mirabilis TaxID=1507867 RepID=A0AAV9JQG3_9PEZI|nr:hypothetical protein LTR36_000693 [Oleoguttula mirabilis]
MVGMALMGHAPTDGWNDEECVAVYKRARRLGCDLVKITMPASRMEDNLAVHVFRHKIETTETRSRLIAYNTGKQGRPSMCFNKILTPVKYPSAKANTESAKAADGMVTAKEVFTSLFASFVYEPMHFFIYGANVSYSLSPAMHNAAYGACGMPHTYGTHSSSSLDDFKRLAREPHFGGVRNVFLCNRTLENAWTLAHHYNELIGANAISELDHANAAYTQVRVLESFESAWPKDFRQPSMIVSSIPTQTADGTPTNFTIPENWLKSPTGGVMVELAYRPLMTPIVKQMRAQAHKGWMFMDGFDVLPEQAFAQFELFTGRRAPRKLMRDEVIKQYMEEQNEPALSARNLDPNPPSR